MGDIRPEDRTTLVASAFAVIAGLVTAGGGIATLLAAEDANDRQDHSGDIARIGGITAITGGFAAAIGGLVAIGMKLAEIRQREDPPAPSGVTVTNDQLQHLIDTVDYLRATLAAENQVVQQAAPPLDQNQIEHV